MVEDLDKVSSKSFFIKMVILRNYTNGYYFTKDVIVSTSK